MTFPAYPAYTDSGVEWLGKVPQHWQVYSLKRTVGGCVNGLWGDEPDGENDIAVIRVADFERSFSTVGLDKLTYRSITPKERQSRLIKSGDLLIEKSGGGEKTLVGCVVLFTHGFDAITSNFVARMRPLVEFDSQFLCYAFGNLYHGRVNYPSVKQVTGIQNLDAESYLQERFCFPARVEQTQIARFLDHETARIDALIEEQQRLIELLKEKRQAVISHAVTKGLDPTVPMKDSDVEWLGEVPCSWRVIKFGITHDKAELGGNYEAGESEEGLPLIKMGNIGRGKVKLDKVEYVSLTQDIDSGHTLKEGDFLFNTRNSLDLVGKVCVWRSELYAALYNSNILRISFNKSLVGSSGFVNYLLNSNLGLEQLRLIARGTTSVAAIYYKDLSSLSFAFPPPSEQREIERFLDIQTSQLDALVSAAEQTVDVIKERRSALISAAVTGKIDVRGWQPPARVQSPELAQEAV